VPRRPDEATLEAKRRELEEALAACEARARELVAAEAPDPERRGRSAGERANAQ
jgi:hypothetical protein